MHKPLAIPIGFKAALISGQQSEKKRPPMEHGISTDKGSCLAFPCFIRV